MPRSLRLKNSDPMSGFVQPLQSEEGFELKHVVRPDLDDQFVDVFQMPIYNKKFYQDVGDE